MADNPNNDKVITRKKLCKYIEYKEKERFEDRLKAEEESAVSELASIFKKYERHEGDETDSAGRRVVYLRDVKHDVSRIEGLLGMIASIRKID